MKPPSTTTTDDDQISNIKSWKKKYFVLIKGTCVIVSFYKKNVFDTYVWSYFQFQTTVVNRSTDKRIPPDISYQQNKEQTLVKSDVRENTVIIVLWKVSSCKGLYMVWA